VTAPILRVADDPAHTPGRRPPPLAARSR
jgi:hypothetical protein